MSAYHTTRGFILNHTDIGEADRIYSLYTDAFGRIDAVARSVRTARSKLKGHLPAYSLCSIMLVRVRDRWLLVDAESYVRRDAHHYVHFRSLARLMINVIVGRETDRSLWEFIEKLAPLNSKKDAILAKADLLRVLGMFPEDSELRSIFPRAVAEWFASHGSSYVEYNERTLYETCEAGFGRILEMNHISK